MPRIAKVNYHVHKDERQAFHIDAGGVVGKLISPELVATPIQVKDVRCGEVAVSFIGRFERLAEDARQVFGRLGKPEVELPRKNVSRHEQNVYGDRACKMTFTFQANKPFVSVKNVAHVHTCMYIFL